MSTKPTPEFEDLIKDNQVNTAELPKKTQDLIAKFGTITDKDVSDAMDQKIYLQVKDFLAEKATAAKAAKDAEEKEKAKKKKDGIDVSGADTATKKETPEEKAAREAAAAAPKKRSMFDTIYGRK